MASPELRDFCDFRDNTSTRKWGIPCDPQRPVMCNVHTCEKGRKKIPNNDVTFNPDLGIMASKGLEWI